MRLLAKFVENTYEKVDRLLDLREGAVNRLAVVDKEIWLDPTEEEGKVSSGTLILAGMPALGTITSVWQSGFMPPTDAIKVSLRVASIVGYVLTKVFQSPVHGGMSRTLYGHPRCDRAGTPRKRSE